MNCLNFGGHRPYLWNGWSSQALSTLFAGECHKLLTAIGNCWSHPPYSAARPCKRNGLITIWCDTEYSACAERLRRAGLSAAADTLVWTSRVKTRNRWHLWHISTRTSAMACRAMSVEILSSCYTAVQKITVERLAVGEWPWSLKVNGIAAIWYTTYHFLLVVYSNEDSSLNRFSRYYHIHSLCVCCDLEKSFSFHKTVEITNHERFLTHV